MKDEAGVSPVIGTLLVFAVFTVATATVIAVARPELVAIQEKGEFDTVTNQMGRVAGEVQRLAIAGDRDDLRQPRLVLPGGSFFAEEGHQYALTAAFMDPDYEDVDGSDVAAWEHPHPQLQDGWESNIVVMPVTMKYVGIGPTLNVLWTMERFDKEQGWLETGSGDELAWEHGQTRPFAYEAGNPRLDTVYRLSVYHDTLLAEDPLLFETYVYHQDRLVYRYDGESGDRELLFENGALFREEHSRLTLVVPSLLNTPNGTLGSTVYTHRVADVTSATPVSASGHSRLGMLMHVQESYPFDNNRGGVYVRVQVDGPNEDAWRTHLDKQGFTQNATPAEGLYYVDEGDTGRHDAFPFHFVWTNIELKVRST